MRLNINAFISTANCDDGLSQAMVLGAYSNLRWNLGSGACESTIGYMLEAPPIQMMPEKPQ